MHIYKPENRRGSLSACRDARTRLKARASWQELEHVHDIWSAIFLICWYISYLTTDHGHGTDVNERDKQPLERDSTW
jgi:hypothetical protein